MGCCSDFVKAMEDGTDNEGYMPLLRSVVEDGPLVIGNDDLLPPIKFCPWCGRRIPDLTPDRGATDKGASSG